MHEYLPRWSCEIVPVQRACCRRQRAMRLASTCSRPYWKALVGPEGTKMCLVLAKALLHDNQMERDLFGEGLNPKDR